MITNLDKKIMPVVLPAAIVDNGSFTVLDIDASGFDHAQFVVMLGASDIALAALKLQESDDDVTYTDIDGLDYSVDGTLPSATDGNKLYGFNVNLLGHRKKYLRLVATAGDGTAGTYLAAWCELSRPKNTPITAAQRGFAAELSA